MLAFGMSRARLAATLGLFALLPVVAPPLYAAERFEQGLLWRGY